MTRPLALPDPPPASGEVFLRAFTSADIAMVRDLATDPYVPHIGTLPAHADTTQALEYIERQWARLAAGTGYSFCVALRETGQAVGQAGLWTSGAQVASAGSAIAPEYRGHGYAAHALRALSGFGWTLPDLDRIELHIEPWNAPSLRTAEVAGFRADGTMPHPRHTGAEPVEMLLYAVGR